MAGTVGVFGDSSGELAFYNGTIALDLADENASANLTTYGENESVSMAFCNLIIIPDENALTDGKNIYTGTIIGKDDLKAIARTPLVHTTRTDIADAVIALDADNKVASTTVNGTKVTDLSDFTITYGATSAAATATFPIAPGKYYAFVTAKTGNKYYTGTASSEQFEVCTKLTDHLDSALWQLCMHLSVHRRILERCAEQPLLSPG